MTPVAIKVPPDGFVRLLDVMGDDKSVVEAARVSYYIPDGSSGNTLKQSDQTLLRYLMRNHHSTPFEMVEFKFQVRVPMDSWRQWVRHRTAHLNEYSTRYSVAIDSAAVTGRGEWRLQNPDNKQGSSGFVGIEDGDVLSFDEKEFHAYARRVYENRLEKGVAREQARKDLPLSTYTEAIWKIDLRNLLHFLGLRLDSHAQYEIRQYAQAIATIIKDIVPVTWQAFEDYQLYSTTFSLWEMNILGMVINEEISEAAQLTAAKMSKREQGDFLEKLDRILHTNTRMKLQEELELCRNSK